MSVKLDTGKQIDTKRSGGLVGAALIQCNPVNEDNLDPSSGRISMTMSCVSLIVIILVSLPDTSGATLRSSILTMFSLVST